METKVKKVIWFARHPLLPEQHSEISIRYSTTHSAVEIISASTLAEREMNDTPEVKDVLDRLGELSKAHDWAPIFGVFAVPVLSYNALAEALVSTTREAYFRSGNPSVLEAKAAAYVSVSGFSAWNIKRSEEGKAPTFKHRQFCRVTTFLFHKATALAYPVPLVDGRPGVYQ